MPSPYNLLSNHHRMTPFRSCGCARLRRARSLAVAVLFTVITAALPVAAQNASIALGLTAERVLGGSAAGVLALWRGASVGRMGGVPVNLRVRADITTGAEPGTDAGRRLRARTTASLSLPISSDGSRSKFLLFGGIGYAVHKVSNVAPEESDPDLARIQHTFHGLVTTAGIDIEYRIRSGTGLWASIGLMRQRLAVETSTIPRLSIGASFR